MEVRKIEAEYLTLLGNVFECSKTPISVASVKSQ